MQITPYSAMRKASAPVAETSETIKALILDDSEVDRTRIRRICKSADLDMTFTEVRDIAEFRSAIDDEEFDIIFVDYILAQGDGLIALEILSRHDVQERAASIMVAGQGQIQVAIDAMKRGCSDYIIKENLTPDVMSRAVRNAIEKTELRAALDTEEEAREAIKKTLKRFEAECAREMRTILSAMLRQSRDMKRQASNGMAVAASDIASFETSCSRLWEFLNDFQTFVSETAEQAVPPLN